MLSVLRVVVMSACGHGGWSQACVVLLGWTDGGPTAALGACVTAAAAEVRQTTTTTQVYVILGCCCAFFLERSIYIDFTGPE